MAPPRTWRLEHRVSTGTWRPVVLPAGAAYLVNPAGLRSTVRFTPVTTTVLRVLAADASTGRSYSAVAVSEWSVHTA